MTNGDFQFMKKIGIEPSSLHDPFPSSLPPPPPPETATPKLAEEDSRWLQDLRVAWEQETEPGFIQPKTLPEYLSRYPTGIRAAVGEVAREIGLLVPDGGLDGLAQAIVAMFLDFLALDLEDVVALYSAHPPVRPGEHRSAHFHDYIRLRVKACVLTMLQSKPRGTDESGESLESR